MCLAISKPAGAVIPIEHLKAGHMGNPHGCGFCYAENGKLTIVKGLFSFEEFYKRYKPLEHLPMLVHFRFSTHGKPNIMNCHPFSILEGKYALIHNGVIKIHCSIPNLSDTGNFSRLVMEPMLEAGIGPSKPAFRYLVESSIGDGNKICLMASDGSVNIYNEDAGSSEDAVDADGNDIIGSFKDEEGKSYDDNIKIWYSHSGYKYCRRKIKKTHEDEYDGFFDCGQGEQAVTEEELNAAGFTNASAVEFVNRAKLDPPPSPEGVIQGFKAGVKQDSNPSDEVMKAYDAINQRSPGRYPPVASNDTFDVNDDTEIINGPIFKSTVELEIAYIQGLTKMTREEVIKSLQLETKDAIAYVQ